MDASWFLNNKLYCRLPEFPLCLPSLPRVRVSAVSERQTLPSGLCTLVLSALAGPFPQFLGLRCFCPSVTVLILWVPLPSFWWDKEGPCGEQLTTFNQKLDPDRGLGQGDRGASERAWGGSWDPWWQGVPGHRSSDSSSAGGFLLSLGALGQGAGLAQHGRPRETGLPTLTQE